MEVYTDQIHIFETWPADPYTKNIHVQLSRHSTKALSFLTTPGKRSFSILYAETALVVPTT